MNSSRPDPEADEPPKLESLRSADPRLNAEAWGQAFALLWPAALRFLNSLLLTGPQHAADREDIAAKAIAELVRGVIENKLRSFNQMTAFDDVRDMLLVILRARTTDFFRSRGRRPEDLTDEVPEPAPESSGEDPAYSWEELSVLIAELPPPQPEIFAQHYAQGRTADEIAAHLHLPRNTVLSHLFRGRKALRRKLDGDHPNPPSS